jgi:peptidoglycan/LPS O-acetylase OafA/YrhL
LAVEEQFYLVWPFLIWWFNQRTMMYICSALFLLSFFLRLGLSAWGVSATTLYVLTVTHLDPLVLGSFIAVAQRGQMDLVNLRRWLGRAALAGATIVGFFFVRNGHFHFWDREAATFGIAALASVFGYALLEAAIGNRSSLYCRILAARLPCALGRVSYAAYLFHVPVGFAVKQYIFSPINVRAATGLVFLPLMGYPFLAGASTWLFALLSWHLYEKHFLRLKRFFQTHPKRETTLEIVRPAA